MLAVLATALGAACAAPAGPLPDHAVDLLAPINSPTLLEERSLIGAAEPLFFGGFYRAEEPAGGRPKRWLGELPGQVRIDLVSEDRRPLELVLELRAAPRADGSAARLEVRFDGAELATLSCSTAWEKHAVTVPAALTGFGSHFLELRPDAARPAAAAGTRRPRTVVVRSIRIGSARPSAAAPVLGPEGLRLPPGTAATWAFWVPPGARPLLQAEGLPAGARAPFTLLTDDGPPRRITAAGLAALAGRPVILALGQPHEAAEPLLVRRLWLGQDAPRAAAPAAGAPGRSLLVVGRLERGFPVTPCSTDPERALGCLLGGRESAALGLPVPAVFDFVSGDEAAVGAFLASAQPPALAALVRPDAPARPAAERLRQAFPGLEILLTELPAGADGFELRAATLEPARPPVNARDLDLTATLLSAAGRTVPATLDGVGLAPFLDGRLEHAVRPAATVWIGNTPRVVVGGVPYGVDGDRRQMPETVLAAAALALSERRQRAARWLWRELPPDWRRGQGRRADR